MKGGDHMTQDSQDVGVELDEIVLACTFWLSHLFPFSRIMIFSRPRE